MTGIQDKIDELTLHTDNRVSVFDVQIQGMQNGTVTLSGRLLDQSQLDDLALHFPDLNQANLCESGLILEVSRTYYS